MDKWKANRVVRWARGEKKKKKINVSAVTKEGWGEEALRRREGEITADHSRSQQITANVLELSQQQTEEQAEHLLKYTVQRTGAEQRNQMHLGIFGRAEPLRSWKTFGESWHAPQARSTHSHPQKDARRPASAATPFTLFSTLIPLLTFSDLVHSLEGRALTPAFLGLSRR